MTTPERGAPRGLLLDSGRVVAGGQADEAERYLAPTVLSAGRLANNRHLRSPRTF